MHRIDNITALASMPPVKEVGPNPNGYFSKGDKDSLTLPTRVDNDFLNCLMDEIINVILAADMTPDKADRAQLYKAIYFLIFGIESSDTPPGIVENPLTADYLVHILRNDAGNIPIYSYSNIRLVADELRVTGKLYVNNTSSYIDGMLDEDDFISNSDTKVATEQSTKAYVNSLTITPRIQSQTINGFTTDIILQNTTRYVSRGATSATPTFENSFVIPFNGNLTYFQIYIKQTVATGATCTVFKNGVATALSATLSGSSNEGGDTGSVSVIAGDLICLEVDMDTLTISAEQLAWSIYLDKAI